jgi:uncharacterized protein (TIGR02646 family)
MRSVDRLSIAAPAALTKSDGAGEKEREAVRAHWKKILAQRKKVQAQQNKVQAKRKAVQPKRKKVQAPQKKKQTKAGESFSFSAYKDAGVKAALEKLFHGKCAYCETYYSAQAPVDVEHFRPKGAVEGEPTHSGYWWIAMSWENLLPSCIDCNRRRKQATPEKLTPSLAALSQNATKTINTGKKDAFPVGGKRAIAEGDNLDAEQPHLIDPTRDNPDQFLEYYIDPNHLIGLMLPRRIGTAPAALPVLGDADDIATAAEAAGVSVRGAVSIQIYGLNRMGLVQARTRVLRHLEFQRYLIVEIDRIARNLETKLPDAEIAIAVSALDKLIERILQEIAEMARPEAPYSALVHHWKQRFLDDLKN